MTTRLHPPYVCLNPWIRLNVHVCACVKVPLLPTRTKGDILHPDVTPHPSTRPHTHTHTLHTHTHTQTHHSFRVFYEVSMGRWGNNPVTESSPSQIHRLSYLNGLNTTIIYPSINQYNGLYYPTHSMINSYLLTLFKAHRFTCMFSRFYNTFTQHFIFLNYKYLKLDNNT